MAERGFSKIKSKQVIMSISVAEFVFDFLFYFFTCHDKKLI